MVRLQTPSNAGQCPGLAVFLGQVLVGLGVVGDPLGDRVPRSFSPVQSEMLPRLPTRRQAVAVAEVARALGAAS